MSLTNNPFAVRSTLEYELPPYAQIKEEHYLPAFYAGFEEHLAEIQAIIDTPTKTFENTIVAMERAGQLLGRVARVFFNITSSDTNPNLEKLSLIHISEPTRPY